ncbi:hypothetical protein HGRIS_002207 [Hohenbuehelia grisea]|uniref:F-box domain-containing protein n=1 Tax=Hohenbuehelia grisea TaxID=104357 RepID=A0ABR3JK99_9AGAR
MSVTSQKLVFANETAGINKAAYDASQLAHASRCNDPPTQGELSMAREYVAALDTDLRYYDDELVFVRSYLDQIQARQTETQSARQRLFNVLSPIRRLPDELLREIFQWCWAAEPINILKPPWTLSMVCRRWRFIALSTSTLWNSIILPPTFKGMNTLLSILIQRSGVAPLDFTLHPTASDDTFLILFAQIYRWRKASLHLTPRRYDILGSFQGHLPNLQEMVLRYMPTAGERLADRSPLHTFSAAFNLTWVKTLDIPLPLIRFPLANLKSLDISCPSLQAYEALGCAQNLEELSLIIRSQPDRIPVGSVVHAPRLKRLVITPDDHILDHLHLPALQHLRADLHIAFEGANIGSQCLGLILRSGCPLVHLHLEEINITDEEVLQIITATPHLRELTLQHLSLSSSTFQPLLCAAATSRCRISQLEKLTVHDHPRDDNIELWLDFVESRLVDGRVDIEGRRIATLKFVKMGLWTINNDPDERTWERTRRLNEDYGFDIDIC